MASMLEIIDCMEPNGDSELSPEEEIAELREELGYCYETIAYLKEEGLNGTLVKRMREIERLQKEVGDLTKLVEQLKNPVKSECPDPWFIQAGIWITTKLVKFFTRKK
jgi:hypothetical protein